MKSESRCLRLVHPAEFICFGPGGRLAEETRSGNGLALELEIGYDSILGRRTDTTMKLAPDGDSPVAVQEKVYGYDPFGRLAVIGDELQQIEVEALCDPNSGLILGTTHRLGSNPALSQTRTVDPFGMITGITAQDGSSNPVATMDYSVDGRGRRTSRTDDAAFVWKWDYNHRDEVVGGRKETPTEQLLPGHDYGYTFDAIGNRISASISGQTSSYTTAAGNAYSNRTVPGILRVAGRAQEDAIVTVNNQAVERIDDLFYTSLPVDNTSAAQLTEILVSAVGPGEELTDPDQVEEKEGKLFLPKTPEDYLHDDDGNLLSDGRWTYEWDGENRLIRMTKKAGPESPFRLEFTYDEQSRRTRTDKYAWDAATTSYILQTSSFFAWDGWMMVGEMTEDGTTQTTKTYIWGWDVSETEEGAGGVGGLLSITTHSPQPAAHYFPIYDGNGNVRHLWGAAAEAIIDSADYGPFGELVQAPETDLNPFWFSTKYRDAESGLLYYGYRFYNPDTGRWLNRDPIEEEGGDNLYGFVGNNGINSSDLLGLRDVWSSITIKRKNVMLLQMEWGH